MLLDFTKAYCRRYEKVSVPLHLIAGSDDLIVNTEQHSVRLHQELASSNFRCIAGCGHMVHHAAPEEVLAAIAAAGLSGAAKAAARLAAAATKLPRRNWLHIGESLAAA